MDLVAFIEEICNGKLHFLCSEIAELKLAHYVKSVQLRSFFIQIQENTDQKKLCISCSGNCVAFMTFMETGC